MLWVIIVLITEEGGDYLGIGLLEPFWKVIKCIVYDRLNLISSMTVYMASWLAWDRYSYY